MADNYGRMTSSEAPKKLQDFCFPKRQKKRDNFAGVICDCGSKNTFWISDGGYQEADASRGMPEIETNGQICCEDCGRTWWD